MQHTRCTLLPVVVHVVLLAATWLSTCASAYAESSAPTFSLNWVRQAGAEQCASSQHLARAIEQLLGPILRSPAEAELSIEGTIAQPVPGVFEMQMRVLSPQGELVGARSFRRKVVECSALTPAIVLVLTLTLDPNAAVHGFPTEQLARISSPEDPATSLLSELNAQPPTPVAVAPSPPRVPAPRTAPASKERTFPSAPQRWHGSLQLGPTVAFALLPSVAGGVGLGSELATPWRVSLLLGLSYWARAAATVHSLDLNKSVRFSAAQAQLSLCIPTLPKSAWQLAACAGGALGLRWTDASALLQAEQVRSMYGGPLLQLGLRYTISARWFVALDVTGALLWPRDRFTYRDVSDQSHLLFYPALASAWTVMSVGVRL